MIKYDTSQFEKDLDDLGIVLAEKQVEQFLVYYEMLADWNRRMNLTAITEYADVMKKHFIDSLSLVKVYDLANAVNVMDVGTGAGFPGLALKIAFPNLQMTLLDSLNKRIHFLNAVIEKLELTDVQTIHGRAEDFAKIPADRKFAKKSDAEVSLRESFDLCVSRAVANLSTLAEYCLPFVKVGGQFISYKSEKVAEELEASGKAISVLGGKIVGRTEFMLPDSDIFRNMIVIGKTSQTPEKYPRKAGLPEKEPL